MNKKTANAYVQIALNYLQRKDNNIPITLENLEFEMKSAFKLYSNSVANLMVKNMKETEKEIIK